MQPGVFLGPLFLPWSELILTAVFVVAVLPLGRLYGRRLAAAGLNLNTAFETGARAWVMLLGFLALCGLLGLVYRLPQLLSPLQLAILEPASWLVAKSAAVFLAAMALELGQGRSREVGIAIALATCCVLGVLGVEGWMMRPVDPAKIFARRARDGSILQSTDVTCTAAALANAVRLYGIETTEADSARALGTRASGTNQLQLMRGVAVYGLQAHYVDVSPERLVRMNRPAIVSIDLGVVLHSILVYGHDLRGNLLVIDPMSGQGKMTPARYRQLLAIQRGVVLTREPLPQGAAAEAVLAEGDSKGPDALRAFQQRWQLPADGRLDETTWLLLTGPQQPQLRPPA